MSYVGLHSIVSSRGKLSEDSGVSTASRGGGLHVTEDYDDDAATSNLSDMESSSSSLSSSASASSGYYNGFSDFSFEKKKTTHVVDADYIHVSPFPQVKTCLIARIKHLDSLGLKTQHQQAPILYENLRQKAAPSQVRKQYSVHDILASLDALDFQHGAAKRQTVKSVVSDEDRLCDEEVRFYLGHAENALSSNEQHEYEPRSHANKRTTTNKTGKANMARGNAAGLMLSRPIALWEQLV